jgi:peptidyl-prolyl isomerase G (cyclophilin G)
MTKVVFGRVVAGKQIIEQIERLSTDERDKPFNDVRIVHCGELELRRPSEGSVVSS